MTKRKRRAFSKQFKADAVRLVLVGGKTVGEVTKQFDLTETTLRDWVRLAQAAAGGTSDCADELGTGRAGRTEEAREACRDGARHPKKSDGLLRQGERMRFAFISVWKARWPIGVQCQVLEVSRSGYYAWRDRPAAARTLVDAEVLAEIEMAFKAGRGNYGSPRVHRELRASGRRVGKKRVERLMRGEGLAARRKRRFRKTTDSNHPDPIAPNVLARNFDVALPNTAWVTDVTYVWTHEGWLYLAAILDLFSRRIVGWAASASNDRALALSALDRATAARDFKAGLVHHSDRGSVYASADYTAALTTMSAITSMSRKGDCWDNAVAESFFATIKGELIDHNDYLTRTAAIDAIGEYIDGFYNLTRRHSALDYVSPIEFELKFSLDGFAAMAQ